MARGGQRSYGNAGRTAYSGGTRGGQDRAAFVSSVLKPLVLSGGLKHGTASNGMISGATASSGIVSNVAGLTVNSAARTYAFDGTAAAGTTANGLVETLAGATGSPRPTPVTVAA
ncbi:hypothetical protein [Sphingomonas sp. MMS24-J13]|uniref:hypothetical protein n=1 Tax=Sphingomonas sp. MMS24-J13 TaxID=3238686 RepID=UPI00384BE599